MDESDLLREELQVLLNDDVIPAIEEYIFQIPEEDWENFEFLNINESITERTRYLLQYLTDVFSDFVWDVHRNLKYEYDDLKAIFGNQVSQAFARAMGVDKVIHGECAEALDMLFLKRVIAVASPIDDDDPMTFLKLGLGLSSLVKTVITIIQELMTVRRETEELEMAFEEQREDMIRIFVRLLMCEGIRTSKTRCCLDSLEDTQERIIHHICTNIRGEAMDIQQNWLQSLSKKVFRDLTKKLACSAGWTLGFMEHEIVDDTILQCLLNQLEKHQRKKCHFITKLFSSARNILSRCFTK